MCFFTWDQGSKPSLSFLIPYSLGIRGRLTLGRAFVGLLIVRLSYPDVRSFFKGSSRLSPRLAQLLRTMCSHQTRVARRSQHESARAAAKSHAPSKFHKDR